MNKLCPLFAIAAAIAYGNGNTRSRLEYCKGEECMFCNPSQQLCTISSQKIEPAYEPPQADKTPVEKLADILGVGVGELFNVRMPGGKISSYSPHRLTTAGTFVDHDNDYANIALGALLTGEAVIEKIPQPEKPEDWKPELGKSYCFVYIDGTTNYVDCDEWGDVDVDLARYAMGNCFPTEEAAEAAKPEMMAKFEAIRREIEG